MKNEQTQTTMTLLKQQEVLLKNLETYDHNLVLKARQTGSTTVLALHCTNEMILKPDFSIIVLCYEVNHFLGMVESFLNDSETHKKNSDGLILKNRSKIECYDYNRSKIIGRVPSLMIVDECAFIPENNKKYKEIIPTLIGSTKICLVSSPNSYDDLFYNIYKKIGDGQSKFCLTKMYWWLDERYNDGLWWEKDDQMKKLDDNTTENMFLLFNDGWKPNSFWFMQRCKMLGNDPKKIRQEFELGFE